MLRITRIDAVEARIAALEALLQEMNARLPPAEQLTALEARLISTAATLDAVQASVAALYDALAPVAQQDGTP